MGFRQFRDEQGTVWQAWSVAPRPAEHRRGADRRQRVLQMAPGEERRSGQDRRLRAQERVRVTAGMEDGWITFESERGKRRLAPIPTGWETLSDPDLAALIRQARPVPKRVQQVA